MCGDDKCTVHTSGKIPCQSQSRTTFVSSLCSCCRPIKKESLRLIIVTIITIANKNSRHHYGKYYNFHFTLEQADADHNIGFSNQGVA